MKTKKINSLKLNKTQVSKITGGNEITDPEIDTIVFQHTMHRQCYATRNGCYISRNC